MRIKAVIWDLDGTLLDTLDDLMGSVNFALRRHGMPERTREEIRQFVGNGVKNLVDRSVPQGTDEALAAKVLETFIAHYGEHSRDKTRPYDGILPLLDALSEQGVCHAIVSNKIDFAVRELSRAYFGERMRVCVGDDPSRRKKPAPDSVLEAMRRMGVSAGETAYVGDSDVDVLTARNAGVACCAVSWGFRDEACLREAGAQIVCATPEELLAALAAL